VQSKTQFDLYSYLAWGFEDCSLSSREPESRKCLSLLHNFPLDFRNNFVLYSCHFFQPPSCRVKVILVASSVSFRGDFVPTSIQRDEWAHFLGIRAIHQTRGRAASVWTLAISIAVPFQGAKGYPLSGCSLPPLSFCMACSPALNMEAVCSSEASGCVRITCCFNPDDYITSCLLDSCQKHEQCNIKM
jgi:hypothetical protein